MEENVIVIRDPKTFCFNFDWPKNVDENLKHKIKFIIKSNESFAENNIKNEIEQLPSKHMIDENPGSVKEIIIPPEKREKILNELRQIL